MKKEWKKIILVILIVVLIITVGILGYFLYKKNNEAVLASENLYDSNFYELVDYVQNVETYLAKATISTTSTHAAESLTYLWREANLAQSYLSRLPIESQELENTEKFLNQVSEYSYALSRKNIKGEELSEEEIKNLEELHSYSEELVSTLNQLEEDFEKGNLSWKDLMSNDKKEFSQSVSSKIDVFSTLEENFHEYSGLIYDGAFSEHLISQVPKVTNELPEISEEEAKTKAKEFLNNYNIQEMSIMQQSQNTEIPSYIFSVKNDTENIIVIAISKKGGMIVYSNLNRNIEEEKISYDEANQIAKDFLNKKGFENMKETYYLNNNGILTINYAYDQNGVIMYPDLIKVKVALDNGEILGVETTGFLSNHIQREVQTKIITVEEAKKHLNKNLNIESQNLAIIPTEYHTEILCYEFKGKIDNNEFMVYINAENGQEEDILVVYKTPNGTLTM